ncbi:hypothetical protein [Enterococcus dongliensis]|uniref:hypothetical protein n=1 Tax=Enterococcus dongliensis TaxID=2559925 RepID=UPI00288FDDC5|nr:hypothetical protein [Enterococcus dongliensis]MDT2613816.1 hypothetical protein [Enterococcus dongliensis]
MFWNKKENPFVVRQDFNYPKVLIKTPHKDIEGCIEEVTFFYLDDHDEKSYHWNTDGMNDNGANDINIEYYSTPNDRYLDKKIIGHKRDM